MAVRKNILTLIRPFLNRKSLAPYLVVEMLPTLSFCDADVFVIFPL